MIEGIEQAPQVTEEVSFFIGVELESYVAAMLGETYDSIQVREQFDRHKALLEAAGEQVSGHTMAALIFVNIAEILGGNISHALDEIMREVPPSAPEHQRNRIYGEVVKAGLAMLAWRQKTDRGERQGLGITESILAATGKVIEIYSAERNQRAQDVAQVLRNGHARLTG